MLIRLLLFSFEHAGFEIPIDFLSAYSTLQIQLNFWEENCFCQLVKCNISKFLLVEEGQRQLLNKRQSEQFQSWLHCNGRRRKREPGRMHCREVIFAVIRAQTRTHLCEVNCINVQAVQVISGERLWMRRCLASTADPGPSDARWAILLHTLQRH